MTIPTRPTHLLTLPREVRQQILIEALLADICQYSPHPFGHRVLPFDKPVRAVFAKCHLKIMEETHWRRPGFWGREPMTRLMRVNKQLYEEVYVILWSDFAQSVFAPIQPENHDEWMHWLQTHNPAAIALVRHLHLQFGNIFNYTCAISPRSEVSYYESQVENVSKRIMEQINSYPGLVSVRLQIFLVSVDSIYPEEFKSKFVERMMRIIASCGTLKVKIFWEPDADLSWGDEAIRECQMRIGQVERFPLLHNRFLQTFPATKAEDPYG